LSTKLAKFLSYLLHPLFMPVYSFILVFQYNTYIAFSMPPQVKIALFTVVIFNTVLMPAFISYVLVKRGTVSSMQMVTKEERLLPFLATTLFFILSSYLLYYIALPRIFFLIILGATITVILGFLINTAWKISVHMMGIGGVLGILMGMAQRMLIDLRTPIIVGFLLAGILGTARLRLEAHTASQLYIGFGMGFFVEFFLLVR
jgi:hypothetical protein